MSVNRFLIEGKTVIITGGAGFLGRKHAEAVIEAKGIPVLLDIYEEGLDNAKESLLLEYDEDIIIDTYRCDITNKKQVEDVCKKIVAKYGCIYGLINNAANNPKVEGNSSNMGAIQFEKFPLDMWQDDIAVGLTGALVCSQVFCAEMAKNKKGVVINISSDLGIIAPDQRIYRKEGLNEEEQNVKPVTYSVVKHALIGLTKYLASYYADKGIRANALCPGGVFNNQDREFLDKLENLIPLGRMAKPDEYKGTIEYMLSDASSYMTGSTLIVDGGRTCW